MFRIKGPLAPELPVGFESGRVGEGDEEMKMAEEEGGLSQVVIVKDQSLPFSTYNIVANSTIEITGDIMFESDKPLECMTLNY